jgi:hypothetical protein
MPGGFTWEATCFTYGSSVTMWKTVSVTLGSQFSTYSVGLRRLLRSWRLASDQTCRIWEHPGAIAGVLGAYILLFPQGKVRVLQGQRVIQVPALIVIGLWIVLQLFSGIGSIANTADTGGVAYMAHIGGFIAGFGLTFAFRGSRDVSATN